MPLSSATNGAYLAVLILIYKQDPVRSVSAVPAPANDSLTGRR